MLSAPAGLLLSLIGLLVDKRKTPAVVGLLIGGGMVAFLFLMRLC